MTRGGAAAAAERRPSLSRSPLPSPARTNARFGSSCIHFGRLVDLEAAIGDELIQFRGEIKYGAGLTPTCVA
jgi:hypothetical protein